MDIPNTEHVYSYLKNPNRSKCVKTKISRVKSGSFRHWRKQQDPGGETGKFVPRVSCTATFAMLGVAGARRHGGRWCWWIESGHLGIFWNMLEPWKNPEICQYWSNIYIYIHIYTYIYIHMCLNMFFADMRMSHVPGMARHQAPKPWCWKIGIHGMFGATRIRTTRTLGRNACEKKV